MKNCSFPKSVRRIRQILCAVAIAGGTFVSTPAASVILSTVVMSGLNNPRGLAFSPTGSLYVAEAGYFQAGGPTTLIRGSPYTYSETGSISRLAGGVQSRIKSDLPALGTPTEMTGPSDIAFTSDGTGYLLTGLGADPSVRATDLAPGGMGLGWIYSFTDSGAVTPFADPALFEQLNNPAGGPVDSHPFRLAAGGARLLVADAGANDLLDVDSAGTVSLISTFPGRDIGGGFPSDAVPTSIAVGPDGNYYVAELTGFPFTPGAARIYQVMPDGTWNIFADGFTMITDLEFDSSGNLYVLEYDVDGLLGPEDTGALIRLAANGMKTTLFSDGLVTPTGLTIGADGAIYIANYGNFADIGEVLRLVEQVPEPAAAGLLALGAAGLTFRKRRKSAGKRLTESERA